MRPVPVRPMSFIGIFGKKFEEERLEATMLDSFASDQESDAERVRRKLVKRAEAKPEETGGLLLRNLENEDGRVRRSVLDMLSELAKDREFFGIILEEMVNPSRNVRKAVQSFLGEYVGPPAVIYASLYEQTMLMVAMSKRKDVPVEDLVSLARLSKETFMDGEVMTSIRDIGFCLDHAKHRLPQLGAAEGLPRRVPEDGPRSVPHGRVQWGDRGTSAQGHEGGAEPQL